MTSHQLAKLLLTLPDLIVTDDLGNVVQTAVRDQAIECRPDELDNETIWIFPCPNESEFERKLLESKPRVNVIRLMD